MRTIAHISDIHFGRIDIPIAEALVEDLTKSSPSLLVVSGDLTQRARREQYKAAAAFLERLPRPQIVVPGNHDVPLWNVISRFVSPLRNYRRYITEDLRPIFRDEEMIVIGLNTTRPFSYRLRGYWKDGKVSRAQLADLREQLRDVPAEVFKVIVTHHPFIPAPNEDPADIVHGAARALDVMEQLGVDLLLAGHLHLSYCDDVCGFHQTAKRSILSIQAGSATSTRRRGQPNAYNWITLAPDELTVEVRSWNGSHFAMSGVTRFVRDEGIWKKTA